MAEEDEPKCNACREVCKGGAIEAPRGGFICKDEVECYRAYARRRRESPLFAVDAVDEEPE